ncbi:aspartyl protease family protein [Lewinella sp. 4G2]|uniref:aspartyl protease family protein n=1 Tax=Lewinella sp. 4G2 TaxID=1803372 RepID=UPI0007B46DC1|nr:aspartyl protease family protein [Lewinella sp. 4G2]OAV45033.1 hypothetical protein A3850_011280 [Lewinella sp. 4G2]
MSHPSSKSRLLGVLALLAAFGQWALAQVPNTVASNEVANYLRVDANDKFKDLRPGLTAGAQSFDFSNNLIYFTAVADGKRGNFILDTGAPEVLINDRGLASRGSAPVGIAAGGEVSLADHFIKSFVFTGKEHRKMWAYSLDLRPLETRIGKEVDGFVGYNLLGDSELRIDYFARTFQLVASEKRPVHFGRQPDHEVAFSMVGHLPVVTVKLGKQKLRLALDTGASVSLIDASVAQTKPSGSKMNIQGLDGEAFVANLVNLDGNADLPQLENLEFASFEVTQQSASRSGKDIHGILGSDYLSKFVIGIDYRRRRLYLWNPSLSK